MLLYRILSAISPLLITLTAVFLFWYEKQYYYFLAAAVVLTLGLGWLLIRGSSNKKDADNWVFYLLSPGLLVLSSFGLLLFLESFWLKLILLIILLAVLWTYFDNLYKQFYFHRLFLSKKPYFQISLMEALIVFFSLAGIFGLRDFLNFSLIWSILLVGLAIFLLQKIYFYFYSESTSQKLTFSLVSAVIFMEIFWALVSLPLVYYVKGIIFTLIYGIYLLLREYYLKESLSKKFIRNYLIIIMAVILLILFTARWF
jgi:hypothetical protein